MQALNPVNQPPTIAEVVEQWRHYEGIINIEVLPPTRIILIETSCNPAAITAPIPSFFEGYQVRYYQRPPQSDIASTCSNDEEMPVE